ncbi:TlpA family protein disulfide reductase [Capnocytophaga stomatis]|uniref:TlpA family protein disulfide reductase n=1 Tax=Capnocytophaga stomatis TaxID=1848904 RepID=UPI00385E67E9
MKKLTSLLILLFVSVVSYSQTKYYSTDGKNRLTEPQIKEVISNLEDKMTKALGTKIYAYLVEKETQTKGDSIIVNVSFDMSDKKHDELFKSTPLSEHKNKEFPKFNLNTLAGVKFDSEKLKGKPTMINFWFTRCAPCIDEMPVLNKIKEKYKDDFNFIAITYEKKEIVENFLKSHSFDFEHLIDAKDLINELGIKSFPLNLFLDKNGVLQYVEGGIPYNFIDEKEREIGDGNEFIKIIEKLKSL